MRLLIIGGSGYVGARVNGFLSRQHAVRILDLKPPADPALDYQPGSVTDYEALSRAVAGMQAVLYMAMNIQKGTDLEMALSSYDVNVKGVYLALRAAREAGIRHAVHCSTMSVYDGAIEPRHFFDEDMPPDARGTYGFTKRLGEEVCRNAWHAHGMSVNALRLYHPLARDEWLAQAAPGAPFLPADAEDVGRAMLAALEYRNGFQAFHVSGDYEHKVINMDKARRLLGWEPLARPRERAGDAPAAAHSARE